jgi:exonuclease SbcC
LSNTEESIKSTESQIADINTRLLTSKDELSKTEQQVTDRVNELKVRFTSVKQETEAERNRIANELTKLPDPTDTTVLIEAESAAEKADQKLSEIERSVENTKAQIARLEGELHTLTRALNDASQIKSLSHTVKTEIAHWSMLAKAFSNDGIISLSIDDAGPTLASLTNDLLLTCFGPRFSIRLDTQRETAKGNMKEIFDITVFDAERDDEKSVSAMSGGEKIWINEAITRAMALYQAQQSGQHYNCLFADESDGALDPERKQQFMRMKRKVLELGGYQSEIFISHTPELWEMADTIIDMDGFRQ